MIATAVEFDRVSTPHSRKAARRFVPIQDAVDPVPPEPVLDTAWTIRCESLPLAALWRVAVRLPRAASKPVKLLERRFFAYRERAAAQTEVRSQTAPAQRSNGNAAADARVRSLPASVSPQNLTQSRYATLPRETPAPDLPSRNRSRLEVGVGDHTPKAEPKKAASRPKQSRRQTADAATSATSSLRRALYERRWAIAATMAITSLLWLSKDAGYVLLQDTLAGLKPRAAYVMADDFQQGIGDEWQPQNLVRDESGLARVAGLTLNGDTSELTNYRADFDVKIASGAVGWVVAAEDTDNYYAYKLVASNDGSSATYRLHGFPVVDGEADLAQKVTRDVPLELKDEGFNRISVVFEEGRVTTLINGYGVDYRPKSERNRGGMGFFAGEGESALIRYVSVNSNQDFLGYALAVSLELVQGAQSFFESKS